MNLIKELTDKDLWKFVGRNMVVTPYAIVKNIFPINESKKQKQLEELTEKKDYYQKGIEEKTGIDLGNIEIKFLSDWTKDVFYDSSIKDIENLFEKNLSQKKLKNELSIIWNSLPLSYLIVKTILNTHYFFANAIAHTEENSKKIIFNDTYTQRIQEHMYKSTKDFEIVHELNHILWGTISKKDDEDKKLKGYKYWSEGFAEYGLWNYFYDIVRKGSFGSRAEGISYIRGLKKVRKITEKHGKEIFLEIPNRWQEFEKELSYQN